LVGVGLRISFDGLTFALGRDLGAKGYCWTQIIAAFGWGYLDSITLRVAIKHSEPRRPIRLYCITTVELNDYDLDTRNLVLPDTIYSEFEG